MEEEHESHISKYNSGIAQLYRLDGLWKDVNNHSRMGLYAKWNEDLDRIWCELARDLPEKEKKTEEDKKVPSYDNAKNDFDAFDTKLMGQGNFQDTGKAGFVEITIEEKKKRNEQYKILMEKELFLRRLENKLGKGTAFSDEDEDNWD